MSVIQSPLRAINNRNRFAYLALLSRQLELPLIKISISLSILHKEYLAKALFNAQPERIRSGFEPLTRYFILHNEDIFLDHCPITNSISGITELVDTNKPQEMKPGALVIYFGEKRKKPESLDSGFS